MLLVQFILQFSLAYAATCSARTRKGGSTSDKAAVQQQGDQSGGALAGAEAQPAPVPIVASPGGTTGSTGDNQTTDQGTTDPPGAGGTKNAEQQVGGSSNNLLAQVEGGPSTSTTPDVPASSSSSTAGSTGASSPSTSGGMKASFTSYGGGDSFGSGACNTPTTACGWYSNPGYNAAVSQALFGVGPGGGAGPVCGQCFRLSPVGEGTSSIVVKVNNLCPSDGNPLCSAPVDVNVNFDLCKDDGAAAALFGGSPLGQVNGTYTPVSCSEWSGGGNST